LLPVPLFEVFVKIVLLLLLAANLLTWRKRGLFVRNRLCGLLRTCSLCLRIGIAQTNSNHDYARGGSGNCKAENDDDYTVRIHGASACLD
jgi:hypothetical protein